MKIWPASRELMNKPVSRPENFQRLLATVSGGVSPVFSGFINRAHSRFRPGNVHL